MDVELNQPMQYMDILVKAVKNQPSLVMVNKIVYPINPESELKKDIVLVVDATVVEKAYKLGITITAPISYVHISNLINLN
jgi:hypothetical protein